MAGQNPKARFAKIANGPCISGETTIVMIRTPIKPSGAQIPAVVIKFCMRSVPIHVSTRGIKKSMPINSTAGTYARQVMPCFELADDAPLIYSSVSSVCGFGIWPAVRLPLGFGRMLCCKSVVNHLAKHILIDTGKRLYIQTALAGCVWPQRF